MHLAEEQIIDPKRPLWKKFKTREFFFDESFSYFLDHIQKKAKTKADELGISPEIELILNGDIFDFDSVTKLPVEPPAYSIHWMERRRGLFPEEAKSSFKMRSILADHPVFVEALRNFVLAGNRLIFTIGNHDIELFFPRVQKDLLDALDLPASHRQRVRICDWFYISNQDTLIEHGHQYDPYCMCQNPIHPMI